MLIQGRSDFCKSEAFDPHSDSNQCVPSYSQDAQHNKPG